MNSSVFKMIAAGLLLGSLSLGPAYASGKSPVGRYQNEYRQSERHQLDNHTREVNRMADRGRMRQAALHDISVETGVPIDQVRAMRSRHPDAGVAGIMNACVMADETKRPPEKFLREHLKGKSWTGIARDNNVPPAKLNARLDHLEHSLTPTGRVRGRY